MSIFSFRAVAVGASLAAAAGGAWAFDVGPFTITGFIKQEFSRTSNICHDCQEIPGEGRQRPWADAIAPGRTFGADDGSSNLFQPYIGTKEFDLGKGFRIKGLYSQRWRDGRVDIEGVEYEKNVTLSHEDYGRLQLGVFPTRGWGVADYPYGTQIGVADAWGASGAGYGLLSRAIRYSLPLFDVADGDLHLEATVDFGDSAYKVHKPRFYELYAQYVKGPWVFDFIAQDAKNGLPSSWTHGPFLGVTVDPANDLASGDGNHQQIFMAMARYEYNAKTVLFGGIRHNRWSGAKANYVRYEPTGDIWNDFFNIACAPQPGLPVCTNSDGTEVDIADAQAFPATSVDISLGATYRIDNKWSLSAGLVHLGSADTANHKPRGQSNAMTLGAIGVGYDVSPGFNVYAFAGAVQYKKKGLAPLSMPGHSSFSGVDSRVATSGNWLGLGAVYTW